MDYKPHGFIHTQYIQQKNPYLPKPNKTIGFKKIKISGVGGGAALGNFVVIFIYFNERNHCVEFWLIVRRLPKISALNPFVKMIEGGGGGGGGGGVVGGQW